MEHQSAAYQFHRHHQEDDAEEESVEGNLRALLWQEPFSSPIRTLDTKCFWRVGALWQGLWFWSQMDDQFVCFLCAESQSQSHELCLGVTTVSVVGIQYYSGIVSDKVCTQNPHPGTEWTVCLRYCIGLTRLRICVPHCGIVQQKDVSVSGILLHEMLYRHPA
jgi:hypothetical protein